MDDLPHPSGLSEILDRTAQIYRSHFLLLAGIAVVPTATLSILAGGVVLVLLRWSTASAGAAHAEAQGAKALALVAALLFGVLPAMLAVTAIAAAAMCHAASRIYLGQSITIRAAYQAVWRRGLRFMGIFVAQLTAIWLLPVGAWLALTLFSASLAIAVQSIGINSGGLFLIAGFFILVGLITYAFWIALRLSLAFPAAVVEQAGAWTALKRSGALSRGTKGRIALLYLLGVALHWLLAVAIAFPFTLGLTLMPGAGSPQHEQTATLLLLLIAYGAALAVHALTRPVYGVALTLFYYDQRIRREGFDIEWMMLRAGLAAPSSAAVAGTPSIHPMEG